MSCASRSSTARTPASTPAERSGCDKPPARRTWSAHSLRPPPFVFRAYPAIPGGGTARRYAVAVVLPAALWSRVGRPAPASPACGEQSPVPLAAHSRAGRKGRSRPVLRRTRVRGPSPVVRAASPVPAATQGRGARSVAATAARSGSPGQGSAQALRLPRCLCLCLAGEVPSGRRSGPESAPDHPAALASRRRLGVPRQPRSGAGRAREVGVGYRRTAPGRAAGRGARSTPLRLRCWGHGVSGDGWDYGTYIINSRIHSKVCRCPQGAEALSGPFP